MTPVGFGNPAKVKISPAAWSKMVGSVEGTDPVEVVNDAAVLSLTFHSTEGVRSW